MKTEERIATLKLEFERLQDWEARYKRLIEWGKNLPPAPADLYAEDNKVKGCQSQVWLSAKLNDRQQVHFEADSDALIVKGLVSLLLFVYQDLSPQEILSTSPQFLGELGLQSHLSPSRANGLQAMAKQIQYYGTAFHVLLSRA